MWYADRNPLGRCPKPRDLTLLDSKPRRKKGNTTISIPPGFESRTTLRMLPSRALSFGREETMVRSTPTVGKKIMNLLKWIKKEL
jgi:hypothetical protein